MGAEIAPTAFYGSVRFTAPAIAPGKGHEQALRAIRKVSRKYRVFSSQSQAFEFCDTTLGSLQVWAYEIDDKGRRKFVAASYETFWRMYSRSIRKGHMLHFYEIIRERRACKLYFDLEYQKQSNPDAKPEQMIQALIEACAELSKCNRVSRSSGDVLEMDSTTEKKFSRHLVFQYIAFHDNLQAGDFARRAVEHVIERSCDLMMVQKPGGEVTPFVDLGVYSRNRCFRLVASSKFSKSQRLLPMKGLLRERVSVSKMFFLQSLVCFLRPDVPLHGCVSPLDNILMDTVSNRITGERKPFSRPTSNATSPFPAVDEYVKSIITPHRGGIYGVTIFSSSETVMYAIKGGYKYCANIGRHHKSNNVILLADLHKGEMYQKCFDPDCRGFRSYPWPLPAHLRNLQRINYQTLIDEDVSDDCLRTLLDEIESHLPGSEDSCSNKECPTYIDEEISDDCLGAVLDRIESQAHATETSQIDLGGGIDDDCLNAAMDEFVSNQSLT